MNPIFQVCSFFFSIHLVLTVSLYQPQWLTNNYIRAGNENVISTYTGSNMTPTYTFTFTSPLSGIPNLGYGIKAYQGNDYFGQQLFEVNRTDLTTSTFSVLVQIVGMTNLYILNVPYIAIDPQFPHHLNSFDNVPVNYSGGDFVNISVASQKVEYYTNIINYTRQAAGNNYTHFSQPLQQNKILLFLTSLFIRGDLVQTVALNPLDLQTKASLLSTETYILNVTIGFKALIQKLNYSMIIFNQKDVQSSLKYMLIYQVIQFTDEGGFFPIPHQFIDNFIMGFTYFGSDRSNCAMHFQWNFVTINGTFGVQMPKSMGRSLAGTVIKKVGFTVFYMKTWLCPNQTVFDPDLDMCTTCPVQNCLECQTLRACMQCDYLNYYALNNSLQCQRCALGSNLFFDVNTQKCQFCPYEICPPPSIVRQSCNLLSIRIPISQFIPMNANLSQIRIQNEGLTIISANITQQRQALMMQASYDREIPQNQIIIIYLSPNDTREYFVSPATPALFYTEQECKSEESIKKLVQAMQIKSYILLFISLLSCKIVGLQLFGVLQLAYFSLGSHSFLHIYLGPLKDLKITNGFNIDNLISNNYKPFSSTLQHIRISRYFINNCNIMLLVFIVFIFLAAALYRFFKFNSKTYFQYKLIKILNQGSVTLLMFNLFNFAYSAAVHFKFAEVSDYDPSQKIGYIVSIVAIAIVVLLTFIILAWLEISLRKRQFGEFKNKFKETFTCNIYIIFSLVYRICLAVYAACSVDYEYGTLIILAMSISFIMYNLINLPFRDSIQNYRACLCHSAQLIILFTANYYRTLKTNTPMSIKGHIHSPAYLQIVLIFICIIFSGFVLGWQIYTALRKHKKLMKVDENQRSHAEFEGSLSTLHH